MAANRIVPMVAAAAAVLASAGVAGYLLWGESSPAPVATEEASPAEEGTAQGNGPAARAGAGEAAAPDQAAAAGKPALDCASPKGDVARVGDQGLPTDAFCKRLAVLGATGKEGGADRVQARRVLDQMIDTALVQRALREEKAEVTDAEVDAALQALMGQPGKEPAQAPSPLLREQVRERLAKTKLVQLRGDVSVSDRDIDAELAAGAPGIDRGVTARVEGWLARTAPNAPAEQREKARQAAEAFAAAVATQPPDQAARAHQVTALPAFEVGAHGVEPEMEAAAQGLRPGQWSPPVATKVGWVVLRGVQADAGAPLDSEELRARVRKALASRKQTAEQRRILAALRAGTPIEVLVDL